MTTPLAQRAWIYVLLRAGVAAALALAVTFSADHSAQLGATVLALFAGVTGVVVVTGVARGAYPRAFLAQCVVYLAGTIAAAAVMGAGVSALLFLVSAFFAVTGILELVIGLRSRSNPASRDWILVGALGAVLALAVLLVPADFRQVITLPDPTKVVPDLTASTIVVGLLGAYWAIAAVYLAIAGLSLKWAKTTVGSENHA